MGDYNREKFSLITAIIGTLMFVWMMMGCYSSRAELTPEKIAEIQKLIAHVNTTVKPLSEEMPWVPRTAPDKAVRQFAALTAQRLKQFETIPPEDVEKKEWYAGLVMNGFGATMHAFAVETGANRRR